MIEVDTGQLKRAVEAQHACTATLIQSVPVKETFEDETVWEGIVHCRPSALVGQNELIA